MFKTILLTLFVVLATMFGLTSASGQQPGTECSRQPGPDWTCRGVTVEGGEIAECEPCADQDPEGCCVYTWRLFAPSISHFNILVSSDVAEKIARVYYINGTVEQPLNFTVINNGQGDVSQTGLPPFGIFLQWYATVKIDNPPSTGVKVYMQVKGKSRIVFTDTFVKRGSDPLLQAWGITTGPGSVCEPGKYATTPRVDVDDIAGLRIRILRDSRGCGFKIEYCSAPDPVEPHGCQIAWLPVPPYGGSSPSIGEAPIIRCDETRSDIGVDVCAECKFVTSENPGWIWYNFYGVWYRICTGVILNNQCCDGSVCIP